MALKLKDGIAACKVYVISFPSKKDKSLAKLAGPKRSEEDLFAPTFTSRIYKKRNKITGMRYTCTCGRYKHGIVCDHLVRHVIEAGQWKLEELVHQRDTNDFYRSQYPSTLPEYPDSDITNLSKDESLYMPVVRSLRRGRPRKLRFISEREKAIAKARVKHKKESRKSA